MTAESSHSDPLEAGSSSLTGPYTALHQRRGPDVDIWLYTRIL